MGAYKISYAVLNEQGNGLISIAKDMNVRTEEIATVSKQLSEDPMFASIRTNLKTLVAQLTESYTIMNEAGKILVDATQKYQKHETNAKQTITNTGVTKTDYHGNSSSAASGGGTVHSAATASSPATATSAAPSTASTAPTHAGAMNTSAGTTDSGAHANPSLFSFGTPAGGPNLAADPTGSNAAFVGATAGAVGMAAGAAAMAAINKLKKKKPEEEAETEVEVVEIVEVYDQEEYSKIKAESVIDAEIVEELEEYEDVRYLRTD